MTLAQNTKKIFGEIDAPPGAEFAKGANPLGILLTTGISLFLLIAGVVSLLYLLWGGFDYITSEGDKEKLVKARHKIQNALIGFVFVVIALVIFNFLVGSIFGGRIIRPTQRGFEFTLPSVGNPRGK